MATLGERIRRLRLQKKWSLAQLERESGVSDTTINQIENGINPNPRKETLEKLAAALGVSVQQLMEDDDAPDPEEALRRCLRLSGIPEDEIELYVDMFRMMNRRLAQLRES